MLTDGLEWCELLVGDVFISYLDSHSDGTRSLQRMHCEQVVAKCPNISSDKETKNIHLGWLKGENMFS